MTEGPGNGADRSDLDMGSVPDVPPTKKLTVR